jgi:hypothetical protein
MITKIKKLLKEIKDAFKDNFEKKKVPYDTYLLYRGGLRGFCERLLWLMIRKEHKNILLRQMLDDKLDDLAKEGGKSLEELLNK